jgi:hypothetical protein
MEALTALLMIAGVILNIALIVKFWGMCNDIKDIRNHIVKTNAIPPAERTETATPVTGIEVKEVQQNKDNGESESWVDKEIDTSGVLWGLAIVGVIVMIILICTFD